MIVVIYAHPYPGHSRACAALMQAIAARDDLAVRSLYDLYPDFDIDARAEQSALAGAKLVVWMGPLYWYGVPALLKHWFDQVLVKGWAYGEGGTAIAGKYCLWVTTTGGDEAAYTEQGKHARRFEAFIPPIEQTARFCRMQWLPPFVVHGAHIVSEDVLHEAAAKLARRLDDWKAQLPP